MFFETIPDQYRFKIDGRPVIFNWCMGDYAFVNYRDGNSRKALEYIREKCIEEFGFNPYIIVDRTWVELDPSCYDSGVVDAVHNWYGLEECWTTRDYGGVRTGVCTPGIWRDSANAFCDPDHGYRYNNNLEYTTSSSLVTMMEGFTDWEEDCAGWRCAEGTYAERQYDYPSQRLNIVRKYSGDPFPAEFTLQAEACDAYHDSTTGNSLGVYRSGNLDIERCLDTAGGWNVGAITAGEWLEWYEIPLQSSGHFMLRYATPDNNVRVRLYVDGAEKGTITLASTGGWQTWNTVDLGAHNVNGNYHTIRIEFLDANLNVDYLRLVK